MASLFEEFKPRPDVVEYAVYFPKWVLPLSSTASTEVALKEATTDAAKKCQKIIETLRESESAKGYIWHKDSFNLTPVVARDKASVTVQLQGRVATGGNMDDEWMVTHLLFALTRRFHHGIATVHDCDGQFLLIESAEALPEWATDDDVTNGRVFISNGTLHLLDFAALPRTGDIAAVFKTLQISEGKKLATVSKKQTICESVTKVISAKIGSVLESVVVNNRVHSVLWLPSSLISLLDANNGLISQFVTTLEIGQQSEDCCDTTKKIDSIGDSFLSSECLSLSKAMPKLRKCWDSVGEELWQWSSVRFTRHLYAIADCCVRRMRASVKGRAVLRHWSVPKPPFADGCSNLSKDEQWSLDLGVAVAFAALWFATENGLQTDAKKSKLRSGDLTQIGRKLAKSKCAEESSDLVSSFNQHFVDESCQKSAEELFDEWQISAAKFREDKIKDESVSEDASDKKQRIGVRFTDLRRDGTEWMQVSESDLDSLLQAYGSGGAKGLAKECEEMDELSRLKMMDSELRSAFDTDIVETERKQPEDDDDVVDDDWADISSESEGEEVVGMKALMRAMDRELAKSKALRCDMQLVEAILRSHEASHQSALIYAAAPGTAVRPAQQWLAQMETTSLTKPQCKDW